MAIMASIAGESFPLFRRLGAFRFAPEVLFALPFAAVWYPLIGWWCLLIGLWSYVWMQTGHHDALPWDDDKEYARSRPRNNTLTSFVTFLANKINIKRRTEAYAWLFQSVKGFLITLPVGGTGFLFWPLGYEIGSHARGRVNHDPHMYAELSSGAGVGVSLIMFLEVLKWL